MTEEAEKRRNPRYPVLTEVWWSLEGGEWEVCETGDLSEVGCFIMSPKLPPLKQTLNISLNTPEGVWLRLKAQVAHLIEIGFSVEFMELTEDESAAITRCIEMHRAVARGGR